MDGSPCSSPPPQKQNEKQRAERDKIALDQKSLVSTDFSNYVGQSCSIFLIGNGLREQAVLTSTVKMRKQFQS